MADSSFVTLLTMCSTSRLWIGTSCDLASAKHLSYFISERNLYMKGGYDGIVKWTAQSLQPETIQLNNVVERITWNDNGDQSCTLDYRNANGEDCSLEADAVISTLPLGVLREGLVAFDPPLPADMQSAISQFGYGALGKVFFEFDDVFWSKENDQVGSTHRNAVRILTHHASSCSTHLHQNWKRTSIQPLRALAAPGPSRETASSTMLRSPSTCGS